jgi:hypothetical protein
MPRKTVLDRPTKRQLQRAGRKLQSLADKAAYQNRKY